MATIKRPQQEPDLNEGFIPVRGGINAYTNSLNETTYTPLGDFYKASKVNQALKHVDVSTYTRYTKVPSTVDIKVTTDDKGNKIVTPIITTTADSNNPDDWIDNEAIKKKLVSHLKDVKAYYEGLMASSVFLTKTVFYVTPPDNSPEFKAMAKCFKAEQGVNKIDPKKKDELLALIKKQPQKTGYTLNVLYEANTDTNLSLTPREKDQAGYFTRNTTVGVAERYVLLLDLAENCKIKPEGYARQTVDRDGIERPLADTHAIIESILTDALAYMLDQYNFYEAGESSEVTNLIDGKSHGFIMRPANMSLYEAFESAVYNPNQEFNTIFRKYRTPQELNNASGLHLSVEEQAVLPFLDASNDYREFQKLMVSQIPVFYDLILALQDYKREHPNVSGGWVNVKELAKFIPRFAHDIEVKGSLRPKYRTLIADTYQLLKLFEIPFEKSTKANGNKIYKYFKFINIDEVEVDKKGNVKALKLDFTQDYYALYSQKVAVILDGMRELDDPQVKMLGARISDYFVCNEPVMTKTINGEPLIKKASELARWAGIDGYENDPKKRYGRLATILKVLTANNKIAGRWENMETHKPEIRGYGKEIGNILIAVYPSENIQNSLITKSQRRANRKVKAIEQKKWLKKLKKFDKGYTNKITEAKVLGITTRRLENMLGETEPITSEVMEIVESELDI